MKTVEEALQKIEEHTQALVAVSIPVASAAGFVLAKDVHSPIDMPPFPQSAMDGYAIRFNGESAFSLIDEVKAGDGHQPELKPGEAVRIFTGAAVPPSAQVVVKQEDTHREANKLLVDPLPKPMANIRPRAEQISKGEIALKAGHIITPATIGYLSTLGILMVEVFRKPKVSILVTGNELIEPGQPLEFGQIYESNGPMLQTAFKSVGIDHVDIHTVKDDFEATKSLLKFLLEQNDMLVCSGGISVGDYDYVGKALNELGVEEVFYKVKQKPGKPLFFGKKEEKLVFALPGNPASALTCFYVYVAKAMHILMGKGNQGLPRVKNKIAQDYVLRGDRALFLKAMFKGDEVRILEGQSSAMLYAFTQSNALAYMPSSAGGYKKGDNVECILLP